MSNNLCISDTFKDFIANCTDTIDVFAQLTPFTSYRWFITDKFDNIYEGSFITDANGFFEIEVSELPAGLLTNFSGSFVLTVQNSGCKPVKFKVAQEYDKILFEIKSGTIVKTNLGCSFSCVGLSGAANALIPFTIEDNPDFVIDYTAFRDTYGNAPLIQVYQKVTPYDISYTLVNVEIDQLFESGLLTTLTIHNGGPSEGYVIIG